MGNIYESKRKVEKREKTHRCLFAPRLGSFTITEAYLWFKIYVIVYKVVCGVVERPIYTT